MSVLSSSTGSSYQEALGILWGDIQERLLEIDEIKQFLGDKKTQKITDFVLDFFKEKLNSNQKLKEEFMSVPLNRWDDEIFLPLFETAERRCRNELDYSKSKVKAGKPRSVSEEEVLKEFSIYEKKCQFQAYKKKEKDLRCHINALKLDEIVHQGMQEFTQKQRASYGTDLEKHIASLELECKVLEETGVYKESCPSQVLKKDKKNKRDIKFLKLEESILEGTLKSQKIEYTSPSLVSAEKIQTARVEMDAGLETLQQEYLKAQKSFLFEKERREKKAREVLAIAKKTDMLFRETLKQEAELERYRIETLKYIERLQKENNQYIENIGREPDRLNRELREKKEGFKRKHLRIFSEFKAEIEKMSGNRQTKLVKVKDSYKSQIEGIGKYFEGRNNSIRNQRRSDEAHLEKDKKKRLEELSYKIEKETILDKSGSLSRRESAKNHYYAEEEKLRRDRRYYEQKSLEHKEKDLNSQRGSLESLTHGFKQHTLEAKGNCQRGFENFWKNYSDVSKETEIRFSQDQEKVNKEIKETINKLKNQR